MVPTGGRGKVILKKFRGLSEVYCQECYTSLENSLYSNVSNISKICFHRELSVDSTSKDYIPKADAGFRVGASEINYHRNRFP